MVKRDHVLDNNALITFVEQLIPTLPGCAFFLNNKGAFRCANALQTQIFGLKNSQDLKGKTHIDLPMFQKYPEFIHLWEETNNQVMKTKSAAHCMVLSLDLKNNVIPMNYNKIPLLDHRNHLQGVLCISPYHDYSISSDTEFHVNYKNILINLPGHVYWKDKNGVYLGCNLIQARDLNLKNCEDIIGKTDYNFSSKTKADAFRLLDNQVLTQGTEIEAEEEIVINGQSVIVLSKKIPLFDDNHNIIGLLGISFDISDRKKAEKELYDAKIRAEIANNAKTEFLRNIEHQLRTPFSGIYSIVELLAQNELDLEKKQMLEVTYQSAKELLDLLNDIIDCSRNIGENLPILEKKFNLNQLIEKTTSMQYAIAHTKGLILKSHYAQELPSVFIGDPHRIRRLLLNLISNALRFTIKGSVVVRAELAKRVNSQLCIVQLIISDTGIGISKEKQDLIYEKFYRVHPANQNKYLGAGLGLFVVKQLISDLEGEIELESSPKTGTTFVCTLPLKQPLFDKIYNTNED